VYEIYASNRAFNEIFYASPTPMWVFDADTLLFLAVNDAALDLYRYSRDEFLRLKASAVRKPEDQERFEKYLLSETQNETRRSAIRHIAKDGTTIYVDITRQRIQFDGRTAWLVMLRDMTEQTRSAIALVSAGNKYKTLVEQSLVGIYTLRGTTISYANPKFSEIFGYGENEVVGKEILDFVSETDKEAARAAIELRLRGDKTEKHYTRTGIRKDGTKVIVDLHAAQVDTEDGPVTFGFVLDVTEAKLAEKRAGEYIRQLSLALEKTTTAISTMGELRDPYTAGHQQRTGTLAEAIGKEMGLSPDTLSVLGLGGVLHDIGKFAIPIEILIKPTRLSPGEYAIIKTHSQLSYDIIKDINFKGPVATAVLQHHERLDGSGYPDGKAGDDIILEAKVLTVADVLESMATNRPYRSALGVDRALAELSEHAGVHYDRDAVRAAETLIREKNYKIPT
jgi:PAS domain S-box-containing protein